MLAAAFAIAPLLTRYLPDLIGWLGGDRAEEVASDVLTVVRGITGGSTDPNDVAAATADPVRSADLALGLARIAADREKARSDAMLSELKTAMEDTANARAQTTALAASGSNIAWAPPIISAIIVSGFFLCVVMLFVVERSWDERTAGLMNALFGALTISFGQVCNYWLGSSRGSAAKDERQGAAVVLAASTVARAAETVSAPAAASAARRLFGGPNS
jgi:hypothetical protein